MKLLNKSISILLFVFILTLAFGNKANALSWGVTMNNGFGEGGQNRTIQSIVVFNDYIYASVTNMVDGAKIFRSIDGSSWTQVNTDGFGDPTNIGIKLIVHDDVLYAGTIGNMGVSGFKLLKTTNGTNWTQIGSDGFGDVTNYSIDSMSSFGGKLYFSVFYIDTGTWATGLRIYRLNSDSSLTKMNTEGFGDPNNMVSYAMGTFDNQLYVGTQLIPGPEIWRTGNGTDWTQVVDNGFGEATSRFVTTIFQFHQRIYSAMMCTTGLEIWRSSSGNLNSWLQVGGDGLGSVDNIWTAVQPVIVNDIIYMGVGNETEDLAKIFTSTDGNVWAEEDNSSFLHISDEGIYTGTFFKNRIYFGIGNDAIGSRILRSEELDPMVITTESSDLPEATKGEEYSYQIEYENGTPLYNCTWDGDLPKGMEVTTDCKIQGTPENASDHTFTVYLEDSGVPAQTYEREFTLSVNDVDGGEEEEVITELPETGRKDIILTIQILCQIVLLLIGLMSLSKITQRQRKNPK